MSLDTAQIRELLAETRAQLLESDDSNGFAFDVLTCYWPAIDKEDLDSCVSLLETYTSAANAEASHIVTDPMQGTRWHRSGTWRRGPVRVRPSADKRGSWDLIRVLHEGWATALNDDECRVRAIQGAPHVAGYRFEQYWPNIATTSLESLLAGIRDTTSITPTEESPIVIDGVNIESGIYVASGIRGDKQSDHSGEISRTLTLVADVTGANSGAIKAALEASDYLVEHKKALESAAGAGGGQGADTLNLVWRNLHHTSASWQDLMQTLTASDLNGIVASLPGASYGWAVEDRTFEKLEDGTGAFVVTFKKLTTIAQLSDLTSATYIMQHKFATEFQYSDGYEVDAESLRLVWPNLAYSAATWELLMVTLSEANLESIVTDLPDTTYGWDFKDRDFRQQDESSGVFEVVYTKVVFSSTTTSGDAIVTAVDRRAGTATRMWPRRTETAKDTLTGTGGAAVSDFTADMDWDGGSDTMKTLAVQIQDHGDGSYTVVQIGVEADVEWTFDDWRNYQDNYTWERKETRRVKTEAAAGIFEETDQTRTVPWTTYILQTTSRTKAYDFAGGTYGYMNAKKATHKPRIQYFGKGRYRVECDVRGTPGEWS